MEIVVRDETTAGELLQELALQMEAERTSVRDLIATRVAAEVRTYNAKSAMEPYRGLVQPTEQESRLNAARSKGRTHRVDVDKQIGVALDAFARGRILVLVDDRQVTELGDEVMLRSGSTVTFLKLTALVGG